MPRGRKGRLFSGLLIAVLVLFFILGVLRLKAEDAARQLPEPVFQAAEASAEILTQLSRAVKPVQDVRLWNLTLVNFENPVPENWISEFTELRYGERVDSRMYPHLQDMFDACREAGLAPVVYSGYRSFETQETLYRNKTEEYQTQGYDLTEAETLAAQWVARPGTSEHQLGLAVDIDSEDTELCSNEAVWAWMTEHCAEYGFILRYPEDKMDITGVQSEPWHFRYVGEEAAREIMERGITLEEYLA